MSTDKAPNRLDLMPPELLNKIYGYLFDLEDAKVTNVNLKNPWYARNELTYVVSTAVLRVNRVIGQGAQSVLYNDNLLVLFHLMDTRGDIETAFRDKSQHFPISFVPDKCALPPCPIIVRHRRYKTKKLDRPGSLAIVVRAFDFPELCKNLNRELQHDEAERECYSVMALPKAGWPCEQLRSLIWEPLRDLRHAIFQSCVHSKMSSTYYKIKVVDGTRTFEPTNKLLAWEAESQHEDSSSDDHEAYSHDDGGYERDRECPTCGGCGIDYETDSDWSSEDDSNSREDPDSKVESYSEVHNHTSETKTLERGTLGADEEPYLGDDERGDDHSKGLNTPLGIRRASMKRLRKR